MKDIAILEEICLKKSLFLSFRVIHIIIIYWVIVISDWKLSQKAFNIKQLQLNLV